MDDLGEGHEVVGEVLGQACMEEVLEDFFVGDVGEGYLVEGVGLHELVEDIGAEDEGLGYEHFEVFVFVEGGAPLDDVVEEGEATSLASEGAFADAGELAVGVEAVAMEDGYHSLVFHAAIGDYGVEDVLTVEVDVGELVPCNLLEEFGYGEEGTGG